MAFSSNFFHKFHRMEIADATELLRLELKTGGINDTPTGFQFFPLHQFMESAKWNPTKYAPQKLELLIANGADPKLARGILTMLHPIPINDQLEFANILLNAGVDPNIPNDAGETAMHLLSSRGSGKKGVRLSLARALISKGANVNQKNKREETALHKELQVGTPCIDTIELLINSCADIHAKCRHGISTLSYAAANPKVPTTVFNWLIERGAMIDEPDSKNNTPLIHAVKRGCTNAVVYLLEHRAQFNHQNNEGKCSLHYACMGGPVKIIKALIQAGADIEQRDTKGKTPLMFAAGNESSGAAMTLLASDANVNALDQRKFSALQYVVANGPEEQKNLLIMALIKRGADINQTNDVGDSALHIAARNSEPSTAKVLVESGTQVNATNLRGETPLMMCADAKLLALLIEAGADCNAQDAVGNTPLMHLIDQARHELLAIKALIDAGTNLNAQNQDGISVLMRASRSNENIKTVKLLVEAGADLDLMDQKGRSATAVADDEIFSFLVASGAKPNALESGKLELALRHEDLPMAITLLGRGIKTALTLTEFMPLKKTLEKLARSNREQLQDAIECVDPETEVELDAILAKFAKQEDIAEDKDLPEVLKKGGWPIKPPKRSQLVLSAGRRDEISKSTNYYCGVVNWQGDRQKEILDLFSLCSPNKNPITGTDAASIKEYLAALLANKGVLQFRSLFKNWSEQSAPDFIDFWNENAAKIIKKLGTTASRSPKYISYMIARFGIDALPGALRVCKSSPYYADVLRHIDAPACAPLMALWMASTSASTAARQWALTYPESCAKGLMTIVTSKEDKNRNAAEAAIRFIASRGHQSLVESIADQFGQDVLDSVKETLSQDFQADFAPSKPAELPRFWSSKAYPTPKLKINNKALPSHAVKALAGMMSMSSSDSRSPALAEVVAACDPKSLSDFAWGAFEDWAAKGKKDSEWIFDALAYLGDDNCARKLTPYIRNWPRENGFHRAHKGLEILAAIGTDVALSQIQAISQKNKYQSILESAQRMMQVIATARHLSPQQLEDRLVPDLGLSANGEMILNFGTRQFTGSVDAHLKPVVRDATGTILKSLPVAGKTDDKTLAREASAEWSALSKELRTIAKLQLQRFELAMVSARRWKGSDFKTLLVPSTLLRNLVKGLVWGKFPSKTQLPTTFMVTAEGTFLDADGSIVNISDGSSIGIVHPLFMDAERLAEWQKIFARNKQLQPFAQLVRKVYRAKDDVDQNRFGLEGATVASKALKGLLAMGWSNDIGDAGWIYSIYKSFPSGQVSVGSEPGVHINDYEMNAKEQKLEVTIPDYLSPMEFSEVIRDLLALKK
jgi:ankyrin repeat protein